MPIEPDEVSVVGELLATPWKSWEELTKHWLFAEPCVVGNMGNRASQRYINSY